MNSNLSGSFYLTKDIDCSDTVNWNEGAGFEPVGSDGNNVFQGVFDGNGYKITGLYISRPLNDNVGLFGYVNSTGSFNNQTIKNVTLENAYIKGQSNVGSVVGYIVARSTQSYLLKNCLVKDSDVLGMGYIGGVAGYVNGSTNYTPYIEDIYAIKVDVSGTVNRVGGHVGNF